MLAGAPAGEPGFEELEAAFGELTRGGSADLAWLLRTGSVSAPTPAGDTFDREALVQEAAQRGVATRICGDEYQPPWVHLEHAAHCAMITEAIDRQMAASGHRYRRVLVDPNPGDRVGLRCLGCGGWVIGRWAVPRAVEVWGPGAGSPCPQALAG